MQPKLLCNSKTDMASHRHEGCTAGVLGIPIDAGPGVHPGPQANICRNPGQQLVAATSALLNAGNAVVLRMQPSQHWANKPLPRRALGFVRPVGKPEARLNLAA